MTEAVEWKMPSDPTGVPAWSHNGIIRVANVLKSAVRLTYPLGTRIKDPKGLFSARLNGKSVLALDKHAGETLDVTALRAIILEVVRLNGSETWGL